MELEQFFKSNPSAALAFSGGVDSAYLLYAAKKYGADVTAYYVRTPFQPQFEYDDAVKLAEALNMPMRTILMDVLEDPEITANPPIGVTTANAGSLPLFWKQPMPTATD